jgi:hypothetical protein
LTEMRVEGKTFSGKFSFRFRVKIASNNETEKFRFLITFFERLQRSLDVLLAHQCLFLFLFSSTLPFAQANKSFKTSSPW